MSRTALTLPSPYHFYVHLHHRQHTTCTEHNPSRELQPTFSSDVRREQLSDIGELQTVQEELVEHDVNVEPGKTLANDLQSRL